MTLIIIIKPVQHIFERASVDFVCVIFFLLFLLLLNILYYSILLGFSEISLFTSFFLFLNAFLFCYKIENRNNLFLSSFFVFFFFLILFMFVIVFPTSLTVSRKIYSRGDILFRRLYKHLQWSMWNCKACQERIMTDDYNYSQNIYKDAFLTCLFDFVYRRINIFFIFWGGGRRRRPRSWLHFSFLIWYLNHFWERTSRIS